MATFYTAVQAAKKHGYTYLVDANGQTTSLEIIGKKDCPESMPNNGWGFRHEAGEKPRISVFVKKAGIGWYEVGPILETCKHPPHRLYSWHVGEVLCITCCDCGAVLAGGAE